jgi:hypothetical protein
MLTLVAEADGNRTRQRRGTPLTGFEDRYQLRRLSCLCSARSFAQVIRDLAGSAGTGRDRACTAQVFPSCSLLSRRRSPLAQANLIGLGKAEVSARRIVEVAHTSFGQRRNPESAWWPDTAELAPCRPCNVLIVERPSAWVLNSTKANDCCGSSAITSTASSPSSTNHAASPRSSSHLSQAGRGLDNGARSDRRSSNKRPAA